MKLDNYFKFLYDLSYNKPFVCIVLFVSYIVGISSYYLPSGTVVGCVYTFLIILVFGAILYFKRLKFIKSGFILFLYLLFVFGFLNAKIHYVLYDDFSNIKYMKDVQITGSIQSIPKYGSTSNTYKMTFKPKEAFLNNEKYDINNSKILLVIKDLKKNKKLKYGDIITVNGTLTTPYRATNPSQFDYAKFLNNKGILKTFYTNNGDYFLEETPNFKNIKNKKGFLNKISYTKNCFERKMNDLRDGVILKHSKYIKSPRLEVLGGVVFGDDAINPPDEVKESFINSGLLHLLAASGLNVAIILSVWLGIIHFINFPYRIKVVSGMVIIFFYTIMTGFPPSIVRATVMLFLILFGKLLYKEANNISLIFIAGLLILIFKPSYLVDVGFQLSFLVTLGIIVCAPCANKIVSSREEKFMKRIKNYPKVLKPLILMVSPYSLMCYVSVPLIAQTFAGPLQAYYFNTFSTYSLFANIAVIPFIGIISCLGFMGTVFSFVPYLSDFILPVLDFILNYVIGGLLIVSNFFSSLPNSIVRVPSPEPFWILLFYICAILFFCSIGCLFKKRSLNFSFIFCLIVLVLFAIPYPNTKTEVMFFDVGNGDNFLIKTPKNKYIMIDTGKYIYNGLTSARTVTLEYLYDKNIREIDTLIVTHYDSDHSGGLIDILNSVRVKNLVIQKPICDSKNSCSIKKYIEKENIKYIEPEFGQEFYYEPNIKLVNYIPHTNSKNSKNDFSTVTLLDVDNHKFLFMADAGIVAYNSIKEILPSDIDVLKTAHHGAKFTVDDVMLKRLNPKYSVISTGKNTYGHPDKLTLEILKNHSKVLSTMDLGAIKFVIDKNEMKVFRYDGKSGKFLLAGG